MQALARAVASRYATLALAARQPECQQLFSTVRSCQIATAANQSVSKALLHSLTWRSAAKVVSDAGMLLC